LIYLFFHFIKGDTKPKPNAEEKKEAQKTQQTTPTHGNSKKRAREDDTNAASEDTSKKSKTNLVVIDMVSKHKQTQTNKQNKQTNLKLQVSDDRAAKRQKISSGPVIDLD